MASVSTLPLQIGRQRRLLIEAGAAYFMSGVGQENVSYKHSV